MSAGWKFVARVAGLQMLVHVCAAAGFVAFLTTSIIQYRQAFWSLFSFWVTGPLPLFLLIPLAVAVPRTAIYERALQAAATGQTCPEPEASAARRQLLGQATYSAAMAILQWTANITAGILMLIWQNHEPLERLLSALLAGVGVFTPLVGIAVWVATGRAVRGYFPVLFADGRVAAYATRPQTLDSRLLVAFVLSGPVAAGLMAAIAYIKAIDILTNPAQGYFHLQAMVGMMFLALGGAFLVALVFRQILTHDFLETVRDVKDALGRLERGEQGVHVPVRGADELGLLAEQANALARHLGGGAPEASAELAGRSEPLPGPPTGSEVETASEKVPPERQAEATLAPPLP